MIFFLSSLHFRCLLCPYTHVSCPKPLPLRYRLPQLRFKCIHSHSRQVLAASDASARLDPGLFLPSSAAFLHFSIFHLHISRLISFILQPVPLASIRPLACRRHCCGGFTGDGGRRPIITNKYNIRLISKIVFRLKFQHGSFRQIIVSILPFS